MLYGVYCAIGDMSSDIIWVGVTRPGAGMLSMFVSWDVSVRSQAGGGCAGVVAVPRGGLGVGFIAVSAHTGVSVVVGVSVLVQSKF